VAKPADKKRQQAMLAVLAVLVLLMLWQYRGLLVPGLAGDGPGPTAASLSDHAEKVRSLPSLELARDGGGDVYEPRRDLFDFGQSPADLERRRQAAVRAEENARARAEAVEKRKNAPPPKLKTPAPPADTPPPEFKYTFIGKFGELGVPESATAVLVKAGQRRDPKPENITLARAGDTVDGQFVIREIGIDSLVIGYTREKFKDKTKKVLMVEAQQGGASRRR